MTRQFFACAFTENGRPYTYHFDGDQQLGIGDRVIVATKHGETTVTVVSVVDKTPSYPTKPIKSLAPVEAEAGEDQP